MTIRRFAGIAALSLLSIGCCCPPMMMCGPPGPPGCHVPVSPFGRFPGPVHPVAPAPIGGYAASGGYSPTARAPQIRQTAACLPTPRRRVARRWPITGNYMADNNADLKLKKQKRIRQCNCEKCRNKRQRVERGYVQEGSCCDNSCGCHDCLSGSGCGEGTMYDGAIYDDGIYSGCDCCDSSAAMSGSYLADPQSSGCRCGSNGGSVQYYNQSVDSGLHSSNRILMPQPIHEDAVPRPLPPPAPPEVPPTTDPMPIPMDDSDPMGLDADSRIETMSLSIPALDFQRSALRSSGIELAVEERVVELREPVEIRTPASDAELIEDTFEQVTIPATAVTRKRIQ